MDLPVMRKWGWIIGFLFFTIVFAVHKDLGVLLGGILVLALGMALARDRMWIWLPALAITWTWVFVIARAYYTGYNTIHYQFFGVSILPIVAWPSILVLSAYHLLPIFGQGSWRRNWLNLSLLYVVGLILIEYIGYHFFNIHLSRGKEIPGWPWLDIMHIPLWMQIGYVCNGVAFFGITLRIHQLKKQAASLGEPSLWHSRKVDPLDANIP